MDFRITPEGQDLLLAAERGTPRIYLDAFGLRFEILPERHERWDATVRGPYCLGCRRIQGHASFTDWSTSERREVVLPERCGHCGREFSVPVRDAAALSALVKSLFEQHVASLARDAP